MLVLPPFRHNKNFPQKWLHYFMFMETMNSCKQQKKSTKPILREQYYRCTNRLLDKHTNGQTERTNREQMDRVEQFQKKTNQILLT